MEHLMPSHREYSLFLNVNTPVPILMPSNQFCKQDTSQRVNRDGVAKSTEPSQTCLNSGWQHFNLVASVIQEVPAWLARWSHYILKDDVVAAKHPTSHPLKFLKAYSLPSGQMAICSGISGSKLGSGGSCTLHSDQPMTKPILCAHKPTLHTPWGWLTHCKAPRRVY